jgi:hypothetical protein
MAVTAETGESIDYFEGFPDEDAFLHMLCTLRTRRLFKGAWWWDPGTVVQEPRATPD